MTNKTDQAVRSAGHVPPEPVGKTVSASLNQTVATLAKDQIKTTVNANFAELEHYREMAIVAVAVILVAVFLYKVYQSVVSTNAQDSSAHEQPQDSSDNLEDALHTQALLDS